jgi:hypothetical protein
MLWLSAGAPATQNKEVQGLNAHITEATCHLKNSDSVCQHSSSTESSCMGMVPALATTLLLLLIPQHVVNSYICRCFASPYALLTISETVA